MPYMHLRTNKHLDATQKESLKSAFGEAIALLPGKSERWLMVDIEDDACLFFAGEGDRPLAILEVDLFGAATEEAYERLTARATELISSLGIDKDGIYVKYAEIGTWGCSGRNF